MAAVVRYCPTHKEEGDARDAEARGRRVRKWAALEQHRGSAHERGYTKAWARARAAHLALHPLCVHCEQVDHHLTGGSVVDHVVPHRGDRSIFWAEGNWQTLCPGHHAQKGARENGLAPCSHALTVQVGGLGLACALCGARMARRGGGAQISRGRPGDPAGWPTRARGRKSRGATKDVSRGGA